MVFLGVDADFLPELDPPRADEVFPNKLRQKPPELAHKPVVYEIVTWEHGKPMDSNPFNEPNFPWDKSSEKPDVVSAFDRLRRLVEQAHALGLNPQLLSFWDNDQEQGIEIRRRMAPCHLTPRRDIFDGVLEGSGMQPCTIIEFDLDLKEPEAERVL